MYIVHLNVRLYNDDYSVKVLCVKCGTPASQNKVIDYNLLISGRATDSM